MNHENTFAVSANLIAKCTSVVKGTTDVGHFADILLPLIFLRLLPSVAPSHHAAPGVKLICPTESRFEEIHRSALFAGYASAIDKALKSAEKANANVLEGLLWTGEHFNQRMRFSSNFDNTLCELMHRIEEFGDFLATDASATFAYAAYHLAVSTRSLTETTTPIGISRLMAKILRPAAEDSVYDPVCGIGSTLFACLDYVREQGESLAPDIYGQEKNSASYRIARLTLALCSVKNQGVFQGDSLSNHLRTTDENPQKFNIVVGDPPWGLRDHGDLHANTLHRFGFKLSPRSSLDYAFILHMISSMSEVDGRMAAVFPAGALSRGGTELQIRKTFISNNVLDAVIQLPSKLYNSTSLSAVLLVFKASKTDHKVLFIDASSYFTAARAGNQLRDADIERVIDIYHSRTESLGLATLESIDTIQANDYDLSINRYISSYDGLDQKIDSDDLSQRRIEILNDLTLLDHQFAQSLLELQASK